MKLNTKLAIALGCILFTIAGSGLKASADSTEGARSLAEAAGLLDVPKIKSESGIVIDADSGAVLLTKNEHKKQYPASITKVMTVLLALEHADPDETMVCSKEAVLAIERGSSHIGIKPGEELVIRDALHGILMASANEISNCIGEYVAGDMKSFAKMMTKRAKELGCRNTNFKNASGLHHDDHYTTAYDMSLILREAMKHDLFREIVTTRQSYIPTTNITDVKRYLSNSNKLIIKNSPYYYENCTGGKTGFTQKAWHTLVNSADDGEMKLLSAVLRSQGRPDKWTDTVSWFDYCYEHFYNLKLNSSKGDKDFKGLRALTKDGEPLVKERSILKYIQDNASVTLPKGVQFSDLDLEAEVIKTRGEQRLIRLTYRYEGVIAGQCEVEEDARPDAAYRLSERIKTQKANALNDFEAAAEAGSAGGHNLLLITASVVAVLIIAAAVFIWIKRKSSFETRLFKRDQRGNKFSFDKSLFKRH